LLLEEAISKNFSLNSIRERVKALQPIATQDSPKATIAAITSRLSQSKVWENPKKWKQVQTLLKKLEALVTEEPEEKAP
jgi:ParB family chromosome partitioning protein